MIRRRLTRTLSLSLATASSVLHAAPLDLAQSPWGIARAPRPNIIVSVDNSSSMGSSGITALKNALRATFGRSNLADDSIRLGWQAMHGCNLMPGPGVNTPTACRGYNGVRLFGGTHRNNFESWVDNLFYSTGTPSHWSMKNAGDYYSATHLGIDSPWAYLPGQKEAPVLACRRSYNIFMTDGEYGRFIGGTNTNDMSGMDYVRIVRGGNADGTDTVLPDGTLYSVNASNDQTRLYRDVWGRNASSPSDTSAMSSLSDLAFYYWSRDLQPSIGNKVPPIEVNNKNEDFGTASAPAVLQPYWNPRNNPATWQHMVTYTIGFLDAAEWTGNPLWKGEHFTGLAPLIRGDIKWPSSFCGSDNNSPCNGSPSAYVAMGNPRKAELWHMALNSRGQFIPAPTPETLATAFRNILKDITEQNTQRNVSIAAASNRVETGLQVFLASFDTERWSGDVQAFAMDSVSGARAETPSWSAAAALDATDLSPSARAIFTHNGLGGAPFEWASLGVDQQALITGADPTSVAEQRLAYLRGDRSLEAREALGFMRNRDSRLGSIVNANLWVTPPPRRLSHEHDGHAAFRRAQSQRSTLVYAGANDGMLHGFDAQNGAERLAYVPRGVYAKLLRYTLPGYSNQAFVDGHPFTGDADLRDKSDAKAVADWRTLLVGSLGAGGRGYFVLDVTDPNAFTADKVLLDRTYAASTPKDDTDVDDLGHIFSTPVVDSPGELRSQQIVKLNNGRWAVVMGNGANSPNERPVLLIQFLDGDRRLLTIVADSQTGQSNGLWAPRLIDLSGDGLVDVAYAGDLRGQLWKFNLSGKLEDQWGVSQWDGSGATCKNRSDCKPFARLRTDDDPQRPQAIVTTPLSTAHPLGGVQLVVGTGRLLQTQDASNTQVQSVYALWDKSTYAIQHAAIVSTQDVAGLADTPLRSVLVEQAVTNAVTRSASNGSMPTETSYTNSARHPVLYSRTDPATKRGWFVNLPQAGERLLVDPLIVDGRTMAFVSTAPSPETDEEACTPEGTPGRHWLNLRDMITGHPAPLFGTSDTTLSLINASRVTVNSNEFLMLRFPDGSGHGDSRTVTIETSSKEGCTESADFDCKLKFKRVAPVRTDWREVRP